MKELKPHITLKSIDDLPTINFFIGHFQCIICGSLFQCNDIRQFVQHELECRRVIYEHSNANVKSSTETNCSEDSIQLLELEDSTRTLCCP